jgi:hypothetical protein
MTGPELLDAINSPNGLSLSTQSAIELRETLRYQVTHKPDISEIQMTCLELLQHHHELLMNDDYGVIMASYCMFSGDESDAVFELVKAFESLKDFDTHYQNLLTYLEG